MTDLTKKFRHWSFHRQRLDRTEEDASDVLKKIMGVYSSHPSGPLSLFARLRSLEAGAFRQLDLEKQAVRTPAMRLSVHLLPRQTAHLVTAATLPSPADPVWEHRYSQKGRDVPPDKYEGWKQEILDLARRPVSAKEIKKSTGVPDEKVKFVLNRMAFERHLLRIGAESLRSNIISYVGTEAWLGARWPEAEEGKALSWLAGEYLRAFGPARAEDFRWWAGTSLTRAEAAFAAHRTVNLQDDYLLLSEDLEEFEAHSLSGKDRLRLLPQWDCYTMGYAPDGRDRLVEAEHLKDLYGSLGATGGNALNCIMVNGLVSGIWHSRVKGNALTVRLEWFDKPGKRLKEDVVKEMEAVATFLGAKKVVYGD